MRVIAVKKPKQKRPPIVRRVLVGLLVLVVAAGSFNFVRPLPTTKAHAVKQTTYAASTPSITWPGYGQSAFGTSDLGVVATDGAQTPLATASIAKVITALCVLDKYPLAAGQSGPTLTISQSDVGIYDQYVANGGSVVAVQVGEQLTEQQVLTAMLLPSANNLADSAAIWAYGSLTAYASYANQYVAMHGLTNTHIGIDASGFDGSTTSTATNITQLGSLAMAQPALAQIVAQPSAYLPVVGTVYNYNFVLGKEGIVGIKTGNNNQDTGAFLFASKFPVGTSTVLVTGAVMGAGSLLRAEQSTLPLLDSVQKGFSQVQMTTKGATVATYTAPWGASAHAVASKSASLVRWNAQPATATADLKTLNVSSQPASVGTMQLRLTRSAGTVSLVLDHKLAGPSFWWRLTRH